MAFNLYIIAGCNGAGKTTASATVLPEMLHCTEFVNADEIAAILSPGNPEAAAIDAGRIMLSRIRGLLKTQTDFAIETTLATRSFAPFIREARAVGYQVKLVFFWLQSAEQAIARVKQRVSKGGHHIPPDVIRRRYQRGLANLFDLYLPICDYCTVFDNSIAASTMIAEAERGHWKIIYNDELWQHIQLSGDGDR